MSSCPGEVGREDKGDIIGDGCGLPESESWIEDESVPSGIEVAPTRVEGVMRCEVWPSRGEEGEEGDLMLSEVRRDSADLKLLRL